MNTPIVFLAFFCGYCLLESGAQSDERRIETIAVNAQQFLINVGANNISRITTYRPFHAIASNQWQISPFNVGLKANVTLQNGTIRYLNTYLVEKVTRIDANQNLYNMTLGFDIFEYEYQYIFDSVINNAGTLKGQVIDVNVTIRLDTTDGITFINHTTVMRSQRLEFSGSNILRDIFFNIFSSTFYEIFEEITLKDIIPHCVDRIYVAMQEASTRV